MFDHVIITDVYVVYHTLRIVLAFAENALVPSEKYECALLVHDLVIS